MEGSSRTRSILGIGLALIGSLLLLRALSAPIVSGPLVGRNVEHIVWIEAQAEAQQAQIEAQAEARLAQTEARAEQQQAQVEAQQAQIEARQAQAEAQAEAQQAQIEARAEQQRAQDEARQALDELRRDAGALRPVPPIWHMGGWLKPTIVLLVLLVLLLWRSGRGERTPAQV